jgi:hypothetical protein
MIIYVAIDGERWLGMAAGRWYDRPRTGETGTLRGDPTRPVHYLARPV